MLYAKIKDSTVMEFPYTWDRFLEETPMATIDGTCNLIDMYSKTQGVVTEACIVEISTPPIPTDIDWNLQMAERDKIPTFVDGHWQLRWSIRPKTVDELEATNTVNFTVVTDNNFN